MDDVKITTGQGSGPEYQSKPPVPPATPQPSISAGASIGVPSQPDFISADNLGPSPIPSGVENHSPMTLKRIFMMLLGLVVVGGVGALGYFVVYPIFFPDSVPTNTPPLTSLPPSAKAPHVSYLVTAPSAVSEIMIPEINYPTIASAVQNEAFNLLADKQYKEIKISNTAGQVSFAAYLGGISPASQALALGDLLESDFTALLYYDANSVWPVYIAKLKGNVSPEGLMAGFRSAEGVLDLANFYVAAPGLFSTFKDGKLGNYNTRYNVATGPGASFNYGLFGNYLIISTNYNALKGVLPLLGL